MDRMINIGKFRFLVNKVLPTVYDDSLSYYEVLCKVINKINEIIIVDEQQNEILNNIPEDVSQFAEQLSTFKREVEGEMNTFETTINETLDEFEREIREAITADTVPTQESTNLITSGGVYAAISDIMSRLIIDAMPTENSDNLVSSGGVYTALQNAIATLNETISTKQNILTFDTSPTPNSSKPVYSGGVYTAINNAVNACTQYTDSETGHDRQRITANENAIINLNLQKQNKLTFDAEPISGSTNPVTSGGVYAAINEIQPITVDATPTQGSTHAVSSGGVWNAIDTLSNETQAEIAEKQDELTFDIFPTQNSSNPVTSGGVYEAINDITPLTVDSVPTQNSTNPVSSGGVYDALAAKQNNLTFDLTPTEGSANPVTSGGIYDRIEQIVGATIDPVPTEDSENAVQSGGVYNAIQTINTELDTKQDVLTFDTEPIATSTNPVISSGIYDALQDTESIGTVNSVDGTGMTLPESADARLQELTVKGRTENDASVGDNGLIISTNGKNFFNINGEVNYTPGNATTRPESWTIDTGATKSTVSDNIITANKNASYYFLDGQKINVVAGETYTLSFRMLESAEGGVVRITYWSETEQKNVHAFNWWHSDIFTKVHVTFTAPTNLILLCFGATSATPASFTDIQLEKGSELTDWEAYKGTTLTITTGLPLRSANENVYDELDCAAGTVTTKCEVVEGEVVPMTTPTITPLTATELAAWRALRTNEGLTQVTASDAPPMTATYLKNTNNGRAIAMVQDDTDKQIEEIRTAIAG